MTFEQLRVLHAIVTEGTFRRAAQTLFKSQPALSNMMKKLEQEVGFEILSRHQYRPSLTAEGQVFYEKALLILNQMAQLSTLSRRITQQQEPLVRVAINAVCPLQSLLGVLQGIEARFPATQLDVSTESMGGAIERLIDGEADIVITTQTGMASSIMEAVPFTIVRIMQVAHKNYPPTAQGKLNAAADMSNYVQLIVADSSHKHTKQSLDVLQGARHWRVTDFQANKDIIMAGMAWGGMPEHLITKELKSGELVPVHVEGIEPRLAQMFLIRRTDKPVGVASDAIWQALQQLSVRTN